MTALWLIVAVAAWAGPAPGPQDPGARAFQRCAACHALQATPDAAAPSLRGVIGRRAGSLPGFAYSDALKAAGRRGLVWDAAALDRYIADPETAVPGTAMPYQGGPAAERAAVIDWLRRNQ